MANYVTTTEINNYLWTSGEDTLIAILNWLTTAYINNFLRVTDLNLKTAQEEEKDYTWKVNYLMNELNSTDLTLVNGSSVVWQTNFDWRELQFEFAPLNTDTVFNKITFTYTYGFATIPDAIKWVVYELVSYLYNARKTAWIKSFTQWQINVTYEDWQQLNKIMDIGLKKYKKNNIYC